MYNFSTIMGVVVAIGWAVGKVQRGWAMGEAESSM